MSRNRTVARLVTLLVAGLPATVMGQPSPATPSPADSTSAPPEPPPEPPAPPPPAPPPLPARPVEAAPPPGPAEIPIGTVAKGPVAPAFPPAIPGIDYGGRLRIGIRFQDPANQTSLGDVSQTVAADLYMSGQIHRMWKWLVVASADNYGGAAGQPSTVSLTLLDAMATFVPMPEFQITAGRLLVMADRYSPSGPWGLDEWFYPGFYPGAPPPALPKSGPTGRDVGVVAWGVPLGGHLKYYLGAYQLQDPSLSPLFSGRVQVSLLSPEPGWFHRTTYYGDRDLVSVGVGGQLQKHGSVLQPPTVMGMPAPAPLLDDYREVNADLIVEKKLGQSGAVSLEGAYYNFQGAYHPWKWSAVAAVAYNSPVLAGIGKLRPSFRFQEAQARQTTAAGESLDPSRLYDAQLTYVIMNWFANVSISYRHSDTAYAGATTTAPAAAPPHTKGNMVVIGVQLWDP
jgi:hypothetical protein